MFRITAFSVREKTIRMTIETTCDQTAIFLRLFAEADRFARAHAFRLREAIAAARRK